MRALSAVGLIVAASGCAGSKALPPETPPAEPAAVPVADEKPPERDDDVEALQRQLDESERDLQAGLGTPASEPEGKTGETGPGAKPSAAQPRRQAPCDVACRALESMKRSAERICELTDQADARCTGADARVRRGTEQVTRAGCACR
jgi:hypothetical protein